MNAAERRLIGWWVALIALTMVSFTGSSALGNPGLAAAAVLGIAFFKVRIVVREFMEVRHAPLGLKIALEAWGAIVAIGLIVMIVQPI